MSYTPEYCSAQDISDFLGITLTTSTKPTVAQVEKTIVRVQEEIDRRTCRTWLSAGKQIVNETKNMNYVYNYGHGVRINFNFRNVKTLDYAQGDRIQFWTGNSWQDLLTAGNSELGQTVDPDYKNGWVFLRGFIYTAISENRFRVTYRYGESPIPYDIQQATILKVCYYLLNTSAMFWKALPIGDNVRDFNRAAEMFKDEAEEIMSRNAEIVAAA